MLHGRGGKPLANLLKEGIILPEDKSAGSVGAEPSLLTLHYFGSAAWAGAYNLFSAINISAPSTILLVLIRS